MLTNDDVSSRARRLGRSIEPLAANVYFAPECHEAYAALGFNPSPGDIGGLPLPDGVAYFTSRGACLGQVPGELVAMSFGVFNPAAVVPAVTAGWGITDRTKMLAARQSGAVASLERIIGDDPGIARATEILKRAAASAHGQGRALFSGLSSLGYPGTPMGDLWRAADLVREHRGDSHVIAWVGACLSPIEIGLLTELFWGIAPKSYIFSRAWSVDQVNESWAGLEARGFIANDSLTDEGRAFREAVEYATDMQERSIVEAIGDDLDELCGLLDPWAAAIRDANGYPKAAGQIAARRAP